MAELPDPSTLSDEELDKIINGEELPLEEEQEEPENPEPAPKEGEEEDPEPKEGEEEEEPAPNGEEPEEEDPKPPSRREQLRIRQVLGLKRQKPAAPKAPTATGLNYESDLETDPETAKRLEEDRRQYAEQIRQDTLRELQSSEWRTRLDFDAPQVASRYPFLDKTNPEKFHAGVADAMNTWYLDMAGYDPETQTVTNPRIRYSDFADGVIELAKEIASNMVEETTKHVRTQAAKTGIRPGGATSKAKLDLSKPPEQMTDEELDAFLQQSFPSKR